MTLLLFDIDGTLLTVDGTGRSVLADTLSDLYGKNISTDGISFSGRTDPDIFRAVLHSNGLEATTATLTTALDAYAAAAQNRLRPTDVRVLPGVSALLERLTSRDDVQLGLVTGNVEPVAYHKLRMAGLAPYFQVGAFGSDHAERAALPPLAAQRAEQHAGITLSLDAVVVIGDTEHDILCARESGARSVAVCTGGSSRADLRARDPDVLLGSLAPPNRFLQTVL